jgi:transposase
MSKKPVKKPDLRDGKAPATTVTNTDERLAGSEKPSVSPVSGPRMVTPEPGRNIPPGQGTKG